MRLLLDYRPALRARTGVGEFIHQLARALSTTLPAPPELCLFTSSWKDRPSHLPAELSGARVVDRRVPVRALSWAWNHLGWPAVETLAGSTDVVHAAGPLLIPTRRAAQVVTIHDLDFLDHPERTTTEAHRDLRRRVHDHARRADHVVVSSHYAAGEVTRALDVPAERVTVCSPGAPDWAAAVAAERSRRGPGSTILFVGTAEPRKNIGALLAAYGALLTAGGDVPRLVIAGQLPDSAQVELARLDPQVRARLDLPGYVSAEHKRQLYTDARLLVLPSFEEGFGLPVLDAMACGVPVVISTRGALPEVAGDAADPVDPHDVTGLTARLAALLDDRRCAEARERGLVRASHYSWAACAESAMRAYAAALKRRRT